MNNEMIFNKNRHFLSDLWKKVLIILAVFGPATITAMADNDAGGVATYSIAGAKLGYPILFLLPVITLLLAITQEMGMRLTVITRRGLADLIREHAPDCCALESVIYVQSYKTAIILGAARGAAILAAAEKGLPVFEYPPKRIKQSTVGRGAAGKDQVAFMVRALLGLTETPDADSADALAIALTHLRMHEAAARGLPGGMQI